ncbi:BrnA antitoxin family protein [Beijerinckia sp. L45]|uniref:BrnA antitoxin family protein n=1 Tax=Beijerinckia sp. L45 TaxID=1641855 RepID=UPI00131E4425|nr:BrnA antitoxin family protein [Beijerinckia sp. L45]
MQADRSFTRLADGTLLVRQDDGSYLPVKSETDEAALARLTDVEIETMAATDPDHPALDDAFWAGIDARPATKEAISIKLDEDILSYFRLQGRGYQTRINAVLRRYVDSRRKAG